MNWYICCDLERGIGNGSDLGYSGTFSFGDLGLGTTPVYTIRPIFYFGTGRLRMRQMGGIWGRGRDFRIKR